jgi:hypothetical protein
MKLERLRTRSGEECLSDLQLDALALGALEAAQVVRAEGHLASCERCARRRELLGAAARGSAGVLAQKPIPRRSAPLAAAARRPMWRAGLGAAGAGLAAAAALLLFIVRSEPAPNGDVLRSKGSSRMGFFVKHGGVVRRGNERERVSPGDALRFVVTSSEPRYVAVLSRDGAGQVSVYHPEGPRAERVEPGVERGLDASVILDDVLGEERLYALSCSTPIEIAGLSVQLRDSEGEPAWPAECTTDRFMLIKERVKR